MGDQTWLIKTVGARAFYCIVLVMLGTSLSMKDRQTDRPTDRRKKGNRRRLKGSALRKSHFRRKLHVISTAVPSPKEKTQKDSETMRPNGGEA